MAATRLNAVLAERLDVASLAVSPEVRSGVEAYLELLARWNRKINLTAHDLAAPTDQAIDRLAVEPIRASAIILSNDKTMIDIGSGGGSPAIPIALSCPQLHVTMVESRDRKAAFLREAVRVLHLNADVEARRFEDVSSDAARYHSADVVTFRAVRPDAGLFDGIDRVLAKAGRILVFGTVSPIDLRFKFERVDGVDVGTRR